MVGQWPRARHAVRQAMAKVLLVKMANCWPWSATGRVLAMVGMGVGVLGSGLGQGLGLAWVGRSDLPHGRVMARPWVRPYVCKLSHRNSAQKSLRNEFESN